MIELLSSDSFLKIWLLDEREQDLAEFETLVTSELMQITAKEQPDIDWFEIPIDPSFDKYMNS